MSQRLAGQVAVVTGASSGIGLATARLFAQEGARVFALARRSDELHAAVKIIGRNAMAVPGDVTKSADLDRLYAIVEE